MPPVTKGARILLEQFLFPLTPYDGKTLPQSLHWNIHLSDDDFVNDFRGKPSQAYCLCHNPGINADGFRQFFDVGICSLINQLLPMKSSGKIQNQRRFTSGQAWNFFCHDPLATALRFDCYRNRTTAATRPFLGKEKEIFKFSSCNFTILCYITK